MAAMHDTNAEDFDARGFVRIPERWNEQLAEVLAPDAAGQGAPGQFKA